MKTTFTIAIAACSFIFSSCSTSENDSVRQAQEQNTNSAIDEKISKFMTEAADARMMDIEQGKLAKELGTSPYVKQYGEWMVADQTKMLKELRMLAASKNIVLPNTLSNKKAKGLEDLKERSGEEFDEKFIKMMTIDHKRDLDDFEEAVDFKDKDVKKFAENYLPVVQSHLDRIKQIRESNQVTKKAEAGE